jgi:hypothetical protein
MNKIYAVILLSVSLSTYAESSERPEVMATLEALKGFNQMRESLAGTLTGRTEPITQETFKQVCAPVGQALKSWAAEKGYTAKQVAEKYRNSDHAPTKKESEIIRELEKTPNLNYRIESLSGHNQEGDQVFYRIPVVASCLHCHGEKDKRPQFIKDKYPKDLAFDFKAGDLRGVYSVFVPARKGRD